MDRNGSSVPFKLNAVQAQVYRDLHTRNVILKARQLGMSTFAILYLLDEAIFNSDLSVGIVSYSLEHAQYIFKKIIGHAIDNLPPWMGALCAVSQRSAREITFDNGSHLRVDTTLRGGAYQRVLVSEFGKTCARNPLKAEEVVTGTLQTVAPTGRIIIESTGEGNEGFFAELVTNASVRGNDNLSSLEYRLHFFPWYTETSYQSDYQATCDTTMTDYFTSIESSQRITLTPHQRNWYLQQKLVLGDKIRQEFPSTIKEAFLSSSDAYYFAQCIEQAYSTNRMLSINPYDALSPVYCAMDIGVNDLTVIVFFQVVHGEIRIIDYYEGNNKGLDHYAHHLLQNKNYIYHTIFLPHDAAHRDGIIVENTYEREFKKLFAHTKTKFIVLKRTDKNIQISNAKMKFERCVFNLTRVKPLIDQLSKYRKKWSEQYGKYLDEPYHCTACFVAGTSIKTHEGDKPIENIKVGDMVTTPNGQRKVINTFKYKTKNLVEVKTQSKSLVCTGHHKIFSNLGLVNAGSLKYNSYVLTMGNEGAWKKVILNGRERELGFKACFLSMNREQLSSLRLGNTLLIKGDILGPEANLFQERFGPTSKEPSQEDLKSTILMKIRKITTFLTSLLFEGVSIKECTCVGQNERNCQERLSTNIEKKQRNGMGLRRVSNGIVNISKKCSLRGSPFKKLVQCAVKSMKQFILGLFYVPQSAMRGIVACRGKIMNQEFASIAQTNSSVTNIQIKNFALHNAPIKSDGLDEEQTKLKRVNSAERNSIEEDTQKSGRVLKVAELNLDTEVEVYDFEVETDHCYYANSVLVSNSNYADSFQYVCSAVTHIETIGDTKGALEKHKALTEKRRLQI